MNCLLMYGVPVFLGLLFIVDLALFLHRCIFEHTPIKPRNEIKRPF